MPESAFFADFAFFAFKQVADIAFVAEQHQQGDKDGRPNPRKVGHKNSCSKGAAIVAVNAAREDTLKPNAITSQINSQTKAVAGESSISTPNAVATPLPPLNPKNTCHICPTSAASATAAIALSDKPSGS